MSQVKLSKSNDIVGEILPIRIYGDKSLRSTSKPVAELNDEIRKIIADLIATMYEKDGVGLAAPQVGINLRIFVVDAQWFNTGVKKPVVFINPQFLSLEGSETKEEGCLSLPEITAEVKRPNVIQIQALNENWEEISYTADELFARAVQHEFDHLDGVVFTDRLSKLRQFPLKRKLKALEEKTDKNGENFEFYHDYQEDSLLRNS